MSGDISMVQVVEALREVYRDDGVAIWLGAEHQAGRFAGRRPIDVCRTAEGRYEVYALACALADGAVL